MVDLELELLWLCAQSETSLLHGILALCLNCKEKCIDDVSVESLLSSVHFCCCHSHPNARDY